MSMVVEGGGVGSNSASEAFRFPPVTLPLVELLELFTSAWDDDDDDDDDDEDDDDEEVTCDIVDIAFDPAAPPVVTVSCCIGGGALSATLAHTVRKHSINGMNRMVRAERVGGSSSNPSFASVPGPDDDAWGSPGWDGSEGLPPLLLPLPPG